MILVRLKLYVGRIDIKGGAAIFVCHRRLSMVDYEMRSSRAQGDADSGAGSQDSATGNANLCRTVSTKTLRFML